MLLCHAVRCLAAIQQYGAEALSHGLRVNGWRIETFKSSISPDAEVEAHAKSLGETLKLPEIFFGSNRLSLTHEPSGMVLSFSAIDALTEWRKEGLPALQVRVKNPKP
jgi:hypothetical protein